MEKFKYSEDELLNTILNDPRLEQGYYCGVLAHALLNPEKITMIPSDTFERLSDYLKWCDFEYSSNYYEQFSKLIDKVNPLIMCEEIADAENIHWKFVP